MWIIIGILLGGWLGSWGSLEDAVGGAVLGMLIGLVLQRALRRPQADTSRLDVLEARVAALEHELAQLRTGAAAADAPEMKRHAATIEPRVAQAPSEHLEEIVRPRPEAVSAESPAPHGRPVGTDPAPGRMASADTTEVADDRVGDSTLDELYARTRDWLFGGNTVVRIGLLVLFFGLAFLARYAAENSLFPIELRLAGIAAGAAALLAVGWRLRQSRPGYALSLQGGGVAVLYLTIFAAMRLYGLIAPGPGFALLLLVVLFSSVLALLQNAQALAVIGTAGGFMAPILASTGQGDHVMLFGYDLLLNIGVLAIAWKKAWRGLNLTGFLFTFSIALAWGVRDYRPELFASTEPFLVAFFLMYVAAAVLYAWRSAPVLRHYVDGTLVFGTPVAGFGLQAALVQDMPFGLAWSALATGGFYVLLARGLHGRARPSLRLLVESFVALGIAFLTLTLPLALDGRWTAAAWALEGVALLWVGARQGRKLSALAGLILQLGAGLFFFDDRARVLSAAAVAADPSTWPVLNGACLGGAMIAVAGFASAHLTTRAHAVWPRLFRAVTPLLLLWAMLWWVGNGLRELDLWLDRTRMAPAILLFMAFSGGAAAWLARRLTWPVLHWPGLLAVPGMGLSLIVAMNANLNPASGWGLPAWGLAVASAWWGLQRAEGVSALSRVLPHAHTAALWMLCLALARMVGKHHLPGLLWHHGAVLALAVATLFALMQLDRRGRWPVRQWRTAYLITGSAGIVAAGFAWALAVSLAGEGDAAPLPYLPLFNPLDIGVALLLMTTWRWWLLARADLKLDERVALAALGGTAFVLVNFALLRAVHHLAGVRWDGGAMFASDTVQTSLSLFWGLLGLALTFIASRRISRALWMVGAALLGVVVAKLFLIDMASTGTVARIVSFLGAGVLLLVVGYLSPLPPARETNP